MSNGRVTGKYRPRRSVLRPRLQKGVACAALLGEIVDCIAAVLMGGDQTSQRHLFRAANGIRNVAIKNKLLLSGIRVYKGTPTLPLSQAALFLGIRNSAGDGSRQNTVASLSIARPGLGGCSVKELIADMELDPESAVEKAIDIAIRGEIGLIYLNADLDNLPIKVPESA